MGSRANNNSNYIYNKNARTPPHYHTFDLPPLPILLVTVDLSFIFFKDVACSDLDNQLRPADDNSSSPLAPPPPPFGALASR